MKFIHDDIGSCCSFLSSCIVLHYIILLQFIYPVFYWYMINLVVFVFIALQLWSCNGHSCFYHFGWVRECLWCVPRSETAGLKNLFTIGFTSCGQCLIQFTRSPIVQVSPYLCTSLPTLDSLLNSCQSEGCNVVFQGGFNLYFPVDEFKNSGLTPLTIFCFLWILSHFLLALLGIL